MDKKKNASSISSSKTFAKRRAIFLSVRKTVNIQGYSELRDSIKTRENCYPLIWQILNDDIAGIFLVFEVQIGMNQSDHRILALQQLERPENFRGERGFEPRPLLLLKQR